MFFVYLSRVVEKGMWMAFVRDDPGSSFGGIPDVGRCSAACKKRVEWHEAIPNLCSVAHRGMQIFSLRAGQIRGRQPKELFLFWILLPLSHRRAWSSRGGASPALYTWALLLCDMPHSAERRAYAEYRTTGSLSLLFPPSFSYHSPALVQGAINTLINSNPSSLLFSVARTSRSGRCTQLHPSSGSLP